MIKKTRIAFVLNFNISKWLGGFNIILNLANYLQVNKKKLNHNLEIIIITKSKLDLKNYHINKEIKIIEDKKLFNLNLFLRIFEKLHLLFFGKTLFMENFLKKNFIDIVSHTNFATGKKSRTKSIVWIPDFQYIHLPNLFSLKYKIFKKINLHLYKKHAFKILLSSNSAKQDLLNLNNVKKNFVKISKFVFQVPKKNKIPDKNYLIKKYQIKKNYIYIPNQYWVHKNHDVVIKAISKIGVQKLNKYGVQIVSTGSQWDYRNPENFNNIISYLKKNKLNNYYKYIGTVRYLDVMGLIKNAQSVLNPSFFEGWSSTVEQAKSFNKHLILSNINTHLEQKPNNCIYFNPKNSNQLKRIILDIFKNKMKLNKKISRKSNIDIDAKLYKYAKEFCNIINK